MTEGIEARLSCLAEALSSSPSVPSSVRAPADVRKVHIADSLTGLEFDALSAAATIADIGSGAGLPGLVLAASLPDASVDLIEATSRKCDFMRDAIASCGIENARVVCERAETWAISPPPDGGREAYDAVTARAVGRLATLAELASPLLREGGALVAWKGRRDAEEETELARAGGRVSMRPVETRWVGPYAGSRNRHLHLLVKDGPTPDGLPRRPGMAKKRPFGR